MTTLAYRAATEADLPFIVTLLADDAVADTPDRGADPLAAPYRDALAAITADPHQDLFIAEAEAKRVGTFQLSYLPGLARLGAWRGIIEAVHVIPEARGSGIGTQMIGFAVQRCRERGCTMVQLTSNKARTDAHRFYERLGFVRSHEGFKLYL
ncbi:GNAT family N-acetyltransferase [Arsenicitalea aurantiaca]|uniref:GNAT family N-acetyltransferase n=1 Tax=Arsenicitalea aurantiaca TaxID=1783274 RepID=A0A433XLP9_9HYPH|nr:GNAT family N-acetyltransferase [Arsenicitalea aurantiaca]RUT35009.1 GNAT family N-acetyltransferase [Arsenicitalea aurantiaca]